MPTGITGPPATGAGGDNEALAGACNADGARISQALRGEGVQKHAHDVNAETTRSLRVLINGIIDEVQQTEIEAKPSISKDESRVYEESAERVGRHFWQQASGDDVAIISKVYNLVEQDVLEQNKQGHSLMTSIRQGILADRRAGGRASEMKRTAAHEYNFHLVAERIAATNLFADINALKRDGINIELSDLDGKELRDAEAFAPDQHFRITMTSNDAMPVALVRNTMKNNGAADQSFGQKLAFESDLQGGRRSFRALHAALSKEKADQDKQRQRSKTPPQ
ncbi:MAG TPA: hypothetical protein PK867_20145 [Pirellulales bacterium]|nr:hypothetical protein [Pirellulales bacterium]